MEFDDSLFKDLIKPLLEHARVMTMAEAIDFIISIKKDSDDRPLLKNIK